MKSPKLLTHAEAAVVLRRLRKEAETAAMQNHDWSHPDYRGAIEFANGYLIGSILRYERDNGVILPRR